MARTRLAILYGGRSAEHQVSVVSARSVMEALDPERFEVVPIAITRDGAWLLPDRSPLELTASDGTLAGGRRGRRAPDLPGVHQAGPARLLQRHLQVQDPGRAGRRPGRRLRP